MQRNLKDCRRETLGFALTVAFWARIVSWPGLKECIRRSLKKQELVERGVVNLEVIRPNLHRRGGPSPKLWLSSAYLECLRALKVVLTHDCPPSSED